ncbi:MAG: hypothetical protein HYZ48_04615, partial [Chlamydiales bacterium]|nr:hypothetical protein [Chlamydiales bacterium]
MKSHLKDAAFPDQDLIDAINNMRYIKETNSFVFTGNQTALDQLRTILPTFDIAPTAVEAAPKGGFYIYKIQQGNQGQIAESLNQMKSHLKDAAFPDQDLIDAINNMRYIKETNSFVFTGNQTALDQLATILPTFDIAPTAVEAAPKGGFYIYKIQHGSEEQIVQSLNQMNSQLKNAASPDEDLINAIKSLRFIKETNSLVFTGAQGALDQLKNILPTFDVSAAHAKTPLAGTKNQFLIYNPVYRSGEELENSLQLVEKNLKDANLANPPFIAAIESVHWVPDTNSLIFTGDAESLAKIENILKTMDLPTPSSSKASQVFIYKPQYSSHLQIEAAFRKMLPNLDKSSLSDQNLIKAIETMQWDPNTQSLIFTSDPATIMRLKELLISLDNPQQSTGKTAQGFFLYKLQTAQGNQVLDELKQLADQIPETTIQNQNIVDAIKKIQWVKSTNSLLITG